MANGIMEGGRGGSKMAFVLRVHFLIAFNMAFFLLIVAKI